MNCKYYSVDYFVRMPLTIQFEQPHFSSSAPILCISLFSSAFVPHLYLQHCISIGKSDTESLISLIGGVWCRFEHRINVKTAENLSPQGINYTGCASIDSAIFVFPARNTSFFTLSLLILDARPLPIHSLFAGRFFVILAYKAIG